MPDALAIMAMIWIPLLAVVFGLGFWATRD